MCHHSPDTRVTSYEVAPVLYRIVQLLITDASLQKDAEEVAMRLENAEEVEIDRK
jgi:hypothetical protein